MRVPFCGKINMTRGVNRLTGADLRRTKPGLFCDGEGLWLQVSVAADGKRRNRSWIFRYTRAGRTREMGLGSLNALSLVEARERARKSRQLLLDGIDPIERRNAERAAQAIESAKIISFEECAYRYIAAHRDSWRSAKHAAQWPQSLAKHVFSAIGKLPVATIDTALIMKTLAPVWEKAPETGSRIRGRIESILDWAAVCGFRQGGNPARWSGHLEHLLAASRKLRPIKHFAAMPYPQVPAFMAKLRALDSTAARALEFAILVAGRRGEVLGATWSEFDMEARIWIVPGSRMKSGREHRVPLSPRCLAILREMRAKTGGELVFPGRDGELARATFQLFLRSLGHGDVVQHGFRSSFRDWAGETTNFPREVCEAALAHATGDRVELAYRRGDALAKRRKLMEAWASYCNRPATGGDVVPLRKAGADA
jgi:integrase